MDLCIVEIVMYAISKLPAEALGISGVLTECLRFIERGYNVRRYVSHNKYVLFTEIQIAEFPIVLPKSPLHNT